MSTVPLSLGGPAGSRRRPVRGEVPASTRFARPDPTGPGAERLLDNLRRLGVEPDERAERRARR